MNNLQIENALRNIGDEELDDNFVGVFASDRMNRFINHAEKRKISFLYYGQQWKRWCTGGGY